MGTTGGNVSNSSFNQAAPDDPVVERSLELGLHRRELTPEALARIRGAVHEEFLTMARAAKRRRMVRVTAIAACLAGLVIAAWATIFPMREGELVGAVASVQRPAAGPAATSGLHVGAQLHAGQAWDVRDPTLLSLASGGVARIAAATSIHASGGNEIELRSGRMYLDFPPGARPFVLHTRGGIIEHVGTQFEVLATNHDVRVRVREGAVRMHTTGGTETVEKGIELFVPEDGRIVRRAVPTFGPDWEWAEAIGLPFAIDNRPLDEFLESVARETGRQLDFADTHAHEVATQTRLHGSVEDLKPLEALQGVLGTTSLRFQVDGGTIRVSSRP